MSNFAPRLHLLVDSIVFPKPMNQKQKQDGNGVDVGVAAFLGGVVGGLIR